MLIQVKRHGALVKLIPLVVVVMVVVVVVASASAAAAAAAVVVAAVAGVAMAYRFVGPLIDGSVDVVDQATQPRRLARGTGSIEAHEER